MYDDRRRTAIEMKAVITLLVALVAVVSVVCVSSLHYVTILQLQQSCSALSECIRNYPPPSPSCPSWMDHTNRRAIIPFCTPYNFNAIPARGCYEYTTGCHSTLEYPCLPPIFAHPYMGGLFVMVPPCDVRQRIMVLQ